MTSDQLLQVVAGVLVVVPVLLAVVAFFLVRLVRKVDRIYDWLAGTPERPGLETRLRLLEEFRELFRDREGPIAPHLVGRLEPR